METLLENETGELRPVVVPYTKKKSPHGDRFLPLSPYEINIFLKIKEINELYGFYDDDYVFCDSEGRTKIREIDYCIRNLCQNAMIPEKSAHDIRRTVASEMYNVGGVKIEVIRDYLGHADVKTTWGHIVNTHDEEQTRDMIIDALKGLNGLNISNQSMI
jgi:integrase